VSISEGENPGSIVSFLPVAKWLPPTLHRISAARNTAMASRSEQPGAIRGCPKAAGPRFDERRILAVHAHPDDEPVTTGGLLAHSVRALHELIAELASAGPLHHRPDEVVAEDEEIQAHGAEGSDRVGGGVDDRCAAAVE